MPWARAPVAFPDPCTRPIPMTVVSVIDVVSVSITSVALREVVPVSLKARARPSANTDPTPVPDPDELATDGLAKVLALL